MRNVKREAGDEFVTRRCGPRKMTLFRELDFKQVSELCMSPERLRSGFREIYVGDVSRFG